MAQSVLHLRLLRGLTQSIDSQRGRLFLFVPVLMAVGIGLYFALPREPTAGEWAALVLLAVGVAFTTWWIGAEARPLGMACLCVLIGMLLAGYRAHSVAAPVLQFRYYGAIEGRIVKIDRSASDAVRLTLDDVQLERVAPHRQPARVRISLHGTQGFVPPEPGLRVMTTGHLGPPPAPSEPGGFDFRRLAWFEGLGAVGYTRVPVLLAAPPDAVRKGLRIDRLRMRISHGVQARMAPDVSGFAAAILTGDRAGIDQGRIEDLRRSNLAHLLAISGLHMGLLTGFVFGALRLAMAMVPPFALRAPTRKIAAVGALAAGAFYLLLSGGNVATERAFIMVAVMLVAVLCDRRAISLRSVALAAVVILALRPEALLQAGFQMSFAATVALVAVFRWLADERGWRAKMPRWALPVLSVVLCSVVAGIATAPVAAASFNRIAEYGLLANLAAVPLMGLVVMPAAVLAAVLTPFGLEGIGLALMTPAIRWILHVAQTVAQLDGAVLPIVQPAQWVMPVMALGALWVIIWQGAAAWLGAVAVGVALGGWVMTDRPILLIAPEAALVGVLGPQGRMLSRARSASFTASAWLQADGDDAEQAQAHERSGFDTRASVVHLRASGVDVVHLTGQRAAASLADLCLQDRIVVTTVLPEGVHGPCKIISPQDLQEYGALAAWTRRDALVWRDVATQSGDRLWTRR